MPGTRRGKLVGLAVVVSLAVTAMVTFLAGLASAGPNPPGNNGTIKIDEVPLDDHPNNEPHVGCSFQVDFYGYDEGDLDAEVIFEAHPPTQRDGDDQVLVTDTVVLGEDDNRGGGSQAGRDASETYTLDVSGIQPHPVQGFHVQLTIHAQGSQGADVKHKVFWVSGCGPSPTTTSTGGGTTTTTTGGTTTTTTGGTSTSGATTTSGASSSSHDTTSTTAAVGGSSSSTPGGPAGGELPFTGAGTMPLLAVGLALLGLGWATLFAKAHRGGS